MSNVIIPRELRAPTNPFGYVEEPDRHPRADATPAHDLGQLQRLREALALLSVGVQIAVPQQSPGTRLGGFRHTSPEQRVVRLSYPGLSAADRAAGLGFYTTVEVVEGVDSRGHKRRISVPLQGRAFSAPAGTITGEVLWTDGLAVADNTLNVSVSCGQPTVRWECDAQDAFFIDAFPTFSLVPAPAFATRARVLVLAGALAELTVGAPLYLPGQTYNAQISQNGTVFLQSDPGQPFTLVSIEWEICE